jgi:anti-anti-sigma factor
MSDSDFSITRDESGPEANVVYLAGELDLDTCDGIADALCDVPHSTVIADLSAVTFMDSSGLAQFISALRSIEARGDRLEFRGAGKQVRMVFDVTGLSDMLGQNEDPDGQPSSQIGLAREPNLSEEAISPEFPPDAKDVFRLFVDGASEYAMFALSPAGVISTWNRGAERIKGYRPDEAIGKHFSILYTEADREAGLPDKILAQALAEGRCVTEGWRLRKDGTRFWASVIVTALYDPTGRLQGFGKLTRDETERRENDAKVLRLEERERIGLSLADTVLRHLFAISVHATGAMQVTPEPEIRSQLKSMVEEADEATRLLRDAIFETQPPRDSPGS